MCLLSFVSKKKKKKMRTVLLFGFLILFNHLSSLPKHDIVMLNLLNLRENDWGRVRFRVRVRVRVRVRASVRVRVRPLELELGLGLALDH